MTKTQMLLQALVVTVVSVLGVAVLAEEPVHGVTDTEILSARSLTCRVSLRSKE